MHKLVANLCKPDKACAVLMNIILSIIGQIHEDCSTAYLIENKSIIPTSVYAMVTVIHTQ